MKWAYYIKYKVATATVLAVIIILIFSGNMLERNSYSTLDNSMSTIYKDRLQASSFIYDISNALHKKKMAVTTGNSQSRDIVQHNHIIQQRITAYEATVLTRDEETEWQSFKHHLAQYNQQEQQYLEGSTAVAALNTQFDETIANLDVLINIQVGEGEHIMQDSHSMVSNRLTFSFFEISLLVILGLCCLVIISAVDKSLFPKWQNQPMN